MENNFIVYCIVRVSVCGIFMLFAAHSEAANQPENAVVALPGNTLTVHANQTLAGSTVDQYSVKNLFDEDPSKAWVFHGEEQYPKAEIIKNPAVLTLTLSRPSALFAIMLTPGYSKSSTTQVLNASPKLVVVSLYRSNDDKPFEKKLFYLHYHAREYSLPALQKELKTVTFAIQAGEHAIGKSDNPINSAERMLMINPDGVLISKVELKVSTIERGAKYLDVAISKIRLLDSQADQNTPEYNLAQFIRHDFDHAVRPLIEVPRCLVYTAQNLWPVLKDKACSAPAPKVLLGDTNGIANAIRTGQDPASHEYQIPFSFSLLGEVNSAANGKAKPAMESGKIQSNELILGKSATGQFQVLSGGRLNEFYLANQHDGLNVAYLQPQDDSYFFFGYARVQIVAGNGGYVVGIHGPAGSQDVKWTSQ